MTIRKLFCATILPVAVAACSPIITTGEGRIQNAAGANKGTVQFEITEEALADNATAVATLSNGEVFRGKLVIAKTQTEEFGDVIDLDSDIDDDLLIFSDSTTYSSKATGVLFSTKRSMQCAFTLNNPSYGFADGGVGQCKISSGEIVPIQL